MFRHYLLSLTANVEFWSALLIALNYRLIVFFWERIKHIFLASQHKTISYPHEWQIKRFIDRRIAFAASHPYTYSVQVHQSLMDQNSRQRLPLPVSDCMRFVSVCVCVWMMFEHWCWCFWFVLDLCAKSIGVWWWWYWWRWFYPSECECESKRYIYILLHAVHRETASKFTLYTNTFINI